MNRFLLQVVFLFLLAPMAQAQDFPKTFTMESFFRKYYRDLYTDTDSVINDLKLVYEKNLDKADPVVYDQFVGALVDTKEVVNYAKIQQSYDIFQFVRSSSRYNPNGQSIGRHTFLFEAVNTASITYSRKGNGEKIPAYYVGLRRKMVEQLLEDGADISKTYYGPKTIEAVESCSPEFFSYLIGKGADPYQLNLFKETPLKHALSYCERNMLHAYTETELREFSVGLVTLFGNLYLQKNPELFNQQTDREKQFLLGDMARRQQLEAIKKLFMLAGDHLSVNLQDYSGCSALDKSSSANYFVGSSELSHVKVAARRLYDVQKLLMEKGVKPGPKCYFPYIPATEVYQRHCQIMKLNPKKCGTFL